MNEKTVSYRTRDESGNDIIKHVKIKQFREIDTEFDCPICKKHVFKGIQTKDIVSTSFTDWAYMDDYVCLDCADLFSLYFYNYITEQRCLRG